ncbi:hypothetical protein FBEOM_4271 [Fusarium beomiforme]|uniref:CHAT domain-containing protein n=1 Tax=Fusarium beomiforme TaxID=44412 RepID=A0A9P5ANG4_9HYPO|nr:hypothetical protein FBEOM_4271 [Fusarium beomiforme]
MSVEDDAKLLHSLAWSHYMKYKEVVEDYAGLREAIELERKAIEASPADSLDHQKYSYYLGLELGDAFYHTGDVKDLDEAISLITTPLEQLPDNSTVKPAFMSNLGILFKEKYAADQLANVHDIRHRKSRRFEDLEAVLRLRRDSLSITADDWKEEKLARKLQLTASLCEVYEEKRTLSHLQEAIDLMRKAVAATSEDDPEWLAYVQLLSVRIYKLYLETGELSNLHEAINFVDIFLNKTGKDHPDWTSQVSNKSVYLAYIYERTGNLVHLEDAIRLGRESLKGSSDDDSSIKLALGNLATALSSRSMVTGSLIDLEEAISYARAALTMAPDSQPGRYAQLHNLGSILLKRFSRNPDVLSDLDEGIDLLSKALDSLFDDSPERVTFSSRLASGLEKRYEKYGSPQDLEEGIRISREAVAAMNDTHVERPSAVNTLAALLKKRCKAGGLLEDVDEAIEISQKALSSMPENSAFRTELWITVGDLFAAKFGRTWMTTDVEEAVKNYRLAVSHPTGDILRRIIAAASVMPLCLSLQEAYNIGREAIEFVPKIAAERSLESVDRQHLLSYARGLAASVTGAAIRLKKDPSDALTILESGRGILGSSLSEIRTDIKELQEAFPQLAERFTHMREELESRTSLHSSDQSQSLGEDEQSQRRSAAKEFNDLLSEIQQKPGFEDFLGPLTMDQIRVAAVYGPIVILNCSWMGCEGIIIQEEKVLSMVLNDLDDGEIIERAEGFDLGTIETLERLWDVITEPVLEVLGFTEPPSNGQEWPHVWWIPTGPLSRFPLHASGRHRERADKTVMDRVISSYSPSLKALIQGRRQREVIAGPAKALLIDMEHTPNKSRLPQAPGEIKSVGKVCESMAIRPVSVGHRKHEILSCLRDCKIFHFAGHGYTNGHNPSKSHLCLGDSRDSLTIGDILKLNLHEKSPFLAYLSACNTGRVQDDKFIDESIYHISAFQLAGFRHVIGTLWKVKDKHCVDVARITYEAIRDGGMTDESVCQGLHKATRELRDLWLDEMDEMDGKSEKAVSGVRRGMRDVIPCDDDEELAPAYWVPYVHFGV